MALAGGDRLGPYEILSVLGRGGMGEVYRARDGKLNREVALKVLPDEFALDADRLARFGREAQVLASLNHPHIAAIYGFEDAGPVHAFVMEMVEGEALRGPLPIAEAVSLAKQIAEALEYAHDCGVVHRDLKPANIKVTPDGVIKLLDFGLAKAVEEPTLAGAVSNSPTLTFAATRAGVILGTAAYMAPEQAHGKAADRRADIWSFGAVLYEMLTGNPAFAGESVSDTLASVLKLEPDWSALPADTPSAIRLLLRRCLTKDRRQRLQSIGEARIVLDDVSSNSTLVLGEPPVARRSWLAVAVAGWSTAAVLAVLAGVATWRWLHPPAGSPAPVVRFTVSLPLASVPGALALSHDGAQLAFIGQPNQQIFVRSLDRLDARPIAGTEGAAFLCFSPDDKWISFVVGRASDSTLKKVRIDGGPVQSLATAIAIVGPPTQSWAATGDIFFSNDGVLTRIPATGGKPEVLLTPRADQLVRYYLGAQLLPDRRHLLVSSLGSGMTGHRVFAFNASTGEEKTLLERAGVTQYLRTGAATGYLAYFDPGTASVMAVPFDPMRLEVTGVPAPVLEGIAGARGPFGVFAVSDSGALVYGPGTPGGSGSTLVWVDRAGTEQALTGPARAFTSARLAPDGQRVAVSIAGGTDDIWIYDIKTGTLNRITSDGTSINPIWTADGRTVIYERRPPDGAVFAVPADGSGPSTMLASAASATSIKDRTEPISPSSVSPDGKTLIGDLPIERQMFVLPLREPLSSGAPLSTFLDSRFRKLHPAFSPDGRWVAYRSDDTGGPEVYVTPYPGPGPRFPISTDGGDRPRWSSTGRELFYLNRNKMMAADVETSPQFRAATPRLLFAGNYANGYDTAADGKRFLMIKMPTALPSAADRVEIVLNWFEELKARWPAR